MRSLHFSHLPARLSGNRIDFSEIFKSQEIIHSYSTFLIRLIWAVIIRPNFYTRNSFRCATSYVKLVHITNSTPREKYHPYRFYLKHVLVRLDTVRLYTYVLCNFPRDQLIILFMCFRIFMIYPSVTPKDP